MEQKNTHLDLFLIGKTGNGKSATGNSILGRNCFKSSPSYSSVTKHAQFDYSDRNGRIIKVGDGPGIGDIDLKKDDALTLVINTMNHAIAANPKGYHAFLLVVGFGGQFTEEDVQTICVLKQIFGEEFVNKFCILVVTRVGDYDPTETGLGSLAEWLFEQEGPFKLLLEECRNRVVLFENKSNDEAVKKSQIDELIKRVDQISILGLRYTDDHFKIAQHKREKILVEAKMPLIQEESMKEASLIIQQLGNIQLHEHEKQLKLLGGLKKRAENLLDSIKKQDKGTGALGAIIKNSQGIARCVKHRLEMVEIDKKIQDMTDEHHKTMDKLKSERDRERKEEEDQQRAERDRQIEELEREVAKRREYLDSIAKYLKHDSDKVHEQFLELRDNLSWEWIKEIGIGIISTVVPLIASGVFKLAIKK